MPDVLIWDDNNDYNNGIPEIEEIWTIYIKSTNL